MLKDIDWLMIIITALFGVFTVLCIPSAFPHLFFWCVVGAVVGGLIGNFLNAANATPPAKSSKPH